MLLAVPSTIKTAASTDDAFKSSIFVSAISRTCAAVTVATLFLLGSPEHFSVLAAFLRRTAAGGVFVINVNERSSNTEISTGIIRPACSCVRALNSLQNPMMFTPASPSSGPTGGSGFALPARICNFTTLITFLATMLHLLIIVMWSQDVYISSSYSSSVYINKDGRIFSTMQVYLIILTFLY